MKTKREIPPIVDFVDLRRVPYDIMDDPRYNVDHPDHDPDKEPAFVKRLRRDDRSRWQKIRGRLKYRVWQRHRRWLRPRTYWLYFCGFYHRLGRGWSEWDLDQYTPHSIDYLIEACDWHATKSWTYPSSYVDDPNWDNTHPNVGREVQGYHEDLMKIKSGMLHIKHGLIGNDEKCTCCGDWCKGLTDPKTPHILGCPIVDEAWRLYTELFLGMWD